jgi:FixJ family two-component response regulator
MSTSTPIVFVVDDEASVRDAVMRLLRAEGLAARSFASAGEFLNEYSSAVRGCIILDVAMPGQSGLELQQALATEGTAPPIIFLSGRSDIPRSVQAMKRGAVDFLTKPIDGDDLIRAVRAALERDRDTWQRRVERTEARQRLLTLTSREREVFEYVIAGMLNKQTAAELGTAEKTVKVHRARVMRKMNVQSVAELVRVAEMADVEPVKV